MNDKLELALIGLASPWLSAELREQTELRHYPTPAELEHPPALILLNPEQTEQQLDWLRRLRADRVLGRLPVFTLLPEDRHDPESKQLLDGNWQSLALAEARVRDWQGRMEQFKLNHPDPAIQQVLAYLWPRESVRLSPLVDWRSARLYRYPLLDCIAGNDDEAALLLHRLRTRQLISPDRLVDRVRSCPACHGSHLSYIDQCPSCQSLDIEQQPSIHCFNCGHVASQENFRRHGVLECPNCHSRLRHIGSDYDRPMENFHCRHCDELFIEPDIRARCMQCDARHEPDQLRVDLIHDFLLGEQGRLLCRYGEVMPSLNDLNTIDLIPPELFRFTLSWTDQLAVRYPGQGYSLLALRLANVGAVMEALGYQRAMQIIGMLAERLRAQLRSTDLATRTADDLYWLLLPNTPASGVATLQEKILATVDGEQDDDTALRVEMASYTSGEGKHPLQDIGLLMETLANEVSD